MQDKEKNKEQPGILETVHMVNEKEKKKNEEERLPVSYTHLTLPTT